MAIDVGAAATNRGTSLSISTSTVVRTAIEKSNPANASGIINSVDFYCALRASGCCLRVGSFFLVSGTTYECRDGQEIGDVSAIGLHEFTGLSFLIDSGDFIGCDGKASGVDLAIEMDDSGGTDMFYAQYPYCDRGDSGSYTEDDQAIISLYGEGEALTELDAGNAATDRDISGAIAASGTKYTIIDYENSANVSGTIDTIEFYLLNTVAGVSLRIGSFHDNGSGSFTCLDATTLGEFGNGYHEVTGLSQGIHAGDYIGIDNEVTNQCYIEAGSSGASYRLAGSHCYGGSTETYSTYGRTISLYATGFEVEALDVGASAVDRASNGILYTTAGSVVWTRVEGSNPANIDGIIDTVDIYLSTANAGNNLRVGSFEDLGSLSFKCHDAQDIGGVSVGLNILTGLSIEVSLGEYIGADGQGSTGLLNIEQDLSGYTVVYFKSGVGLCDPGDTDTLGEQTGDAISLYGTGFARLDVGTPAIDRADTMNLGNNTVVAGSNPATHDGVIDYVEAYFSSYTAGNLFRVGTFEHEGSNVLTCHDGVALGEITSTGLHVFTGLSLGISQGEYLGADGNYLTSYPLGIDRVTTGGSGVWYLLGAFCDPTDSDTFTLLSTNTLSLWGEGYIFEPPVTHECAGVSAGVSTASASLTVIPAPLSSTKYPTLGSDDASEGTLAWDDPTNIYADDANYASVTASQFKNSAITHRLKAQDFDFAIPGGATIVGIKVEIERYADNGTALDYRVQLLDAAGSLAGDNKADTVTGWDTSPTIKEYGGKTDTWNASLDDTDINDPDFGVVLAAINPVSGAEDIFVDYIRITVYYLAGGEKLLAAVSTGASTVAGAIKASRKIAGSSTGASTASGFTSILRKIAGISAGLSTVSGTLQRIKTLIGSTAGAATAAGALAIARGLGGISTGLSTVAGAIKVSRLLAGIANATSTVTGFVKAVRKVAGSSAGLSTVTGLLKRIRSLQGISAGTSTTSGTLVTVAVKLLAGISSAISTVSGAFKITRKLVGSSTGAATVSGALKVMRKLLASTAGVSTVTGAIKIARKLLGLSTGVSTVTGTLKKSILLQGVSNAVSTVSGFLKRLVTIQGISNALSTASAALSVGGEILMAGLSQGVSTVVGAIKATRKFVGSSAGISTVVGALSVAGVVLLAAISSGVSTVSGGIKVMRKLIASSAGVSTVSGFMKRVIKLAGTSTGLATAIGSLITKVGQWLRLKLFTETHHDVKLWTQTHHDIVLFTETHHDVKIWTGESDMTVRTDWQAGETVPIWAEVRLVSTGALYDPDSAKLTVTSPVTGASVVSLQDMTQVSTGMYVYYWNSIGDDEETPSEKGWYACKGKVQDGSGADAKITIENGGFRLY